MVSSVSSSLEAKAGAEGRGQRVEQGSGGAGQGGQGRARQVRARQGEKAGKRRAEVGAR